jgi:hypothetical protein
MIHLPIPDIHVFNIVLGVVSAVGVTGAIVLAVMAPALAETLFSSFLTIMGRILGTRVGVGAVVGIGCLITGELYGTHQANLTCRATIAANAKQADTEATKRDQDQAALTDTDVQANLKQLQTLNQAQEGKIHDYEAILATRKSAVCTLSADDLQRLPN